MMRALAQFIMRGRFQAISIALIGSWVPLMTQATVSLVSLRKGWQEGLYICLWATLPILIGLWIGNAVTTIVYFKVAVLFVSCALSLVLRYTVSWSATLAAMVACSMLAAIAVHLISPDLLAEAKAFLEQLGASSGDASAETEKVVQEHLAAWSAHMVTSLIAFWIGMSALIGLLVARWWQAMLYNPGGFRQELHHLRLTQSVAVPCLLASVFCIALGGDYQFWASLFSLPLLVAGLGLAHCALAKYKVGVGAVVALYVALIIVPPLGLMLSIIGFTDVWLDYRKRFNLAQ